MTEHDRLDERPDPDVLLARLTGGGRDGRGRLRVYLGMAPGVGKTYRMLEEGHRRAERGTDVVVGFVETHGRPRTAALLDGLEVLPRRHLEYRGVVVEELDTDGLIARRPTVALIDELAHTNVPGSLLPKRWQDVDRIRDAGIHVVSTCNIQHLESVADAVATITGAPVRERIPDTVLDDADEIELVDMSPHALRQRMRHGNIYPPDRAAVALERFFTEANLTALREIALRRVARQVDEELEEVGEGQPASSLGSVAERVLVLVDEGPGGRAAIHRAATLAATLHAPLFALVIEGAGEDGRDDPGSSLGYAEDLGARLVRTAGDDPAGAVITACRRHRITHLVIAHRVTAGWRDRLRPRLSDAVLATLPDLEVHLVAAPGARGSGPHPTPS